MGADKTTGETLGEQIARAEFDKRRAAFFAETPDPDSMEWIERGISEGFIGLIDV